MIFKTWLTDLTKIKGVVNNIKNISATVNGATGLLNPNIVNSLSTSINGLNLQQAQLALSTKNLTKEQMNQVLVQAGLIASENQIKAELVQSALAQAGLSSEKQKAILIETGLINRKTGEVLATKACTKEKLLEVLATKGVTGANAEAIISILGLSNANEKATLSFGLFTTATWAQVKAQLALMASNPMTWIMAIGAVIYGIVKEVEYFTGSTERAMESLEETSQAFDDTTSELESLNDELKTTTDRIKELEKLKESGKISVADEEELKTLKEQNKELQRQIVLKRQDQVEDAKDVLDDLDEADLTVESRYDSFTVQGVVYGNMVTRAEEANNALKGYNKLIYI